MYRYVTLCFFPMVILHHCYLLRKYLTYLKHENKQFVVNLMLWFGFSYLGYTRHRLLFVVKLKEVIFEMYSKCVLYWYTKIINRLGFNSYFFAFIAVKIVFHKIRCGFCVEISIKWFIFNVIVCNSVSIIIGQNYLKYSNKKNN